MRIVSNKIGLIVYKKLPNSGSFLENNVSRYSTINRCNKDDKSKYYKQYWINQSGENGRNNRAKVTYTKDGVEYTEYYNYVAKASQYNDEMDLDNGSIFLARVEEGTDGKWHAAVDDSDFSFGNFNTEDDVDAAIKALTEICS